MRKEPEEMKQTVKRVIAFLVAVIFTFTTCVTANPYTVMATGESGDVVTESSEPTEAPAPTETEIPELTATEAPEPTATEAPEPTATEAPEPTATEAPEPTATEAPKPTTTETPEPTATEAPKPTTTETPEPTATETPKLTTTKAPKSTKTETQAPTTAPVEKKYEYTIVLPDLICKVPWNNKTEDKIIVEYGDKSYEVKEKLVDKKTQYYISDTVKFEKADQIKIKCDNYTFPAKIKSADNKEVANIVLSTDKIEIKSAVPNVKIKEISGEAAITVGTTGTYEAVLETVETKGDETADTAVKDAWKEHLTWTVEGEDTSGVKLETIKENKVQAKISSPGFKGGNEKTVNLKAQIKDGDKNYVDDTTSITVKKKQPIIGILITPKSPAVWNNKLSITLDTDENFRGKITVTDQIQNKEFSMVRDQIVFDWNFTNWQESFKFEFAYDGKDDTVYATQRMEREYYTTKDSQTFEAPEEIASTYGAQKASVAEITGTEGEWEYTYDWKDDKVGGTFEVKENTLYFTPVINSEEGIKYPDAGEYGVTVTRTNPNYNDVSVNIKVKIDKKPVGADITCENRKYDGTTEVTVEGLLNQDDFVADDLKDIPEEFFKVTTVGNTTDKNVGKNKPVTYEEFSFPEGYETITGNYAIETEKATTVTIESKTVSVENVIGTARKYDGTTKVTVDGLLNQEDFVADDLKDIPEGFFKVTTTGNTTDKNVGENKPVTYEEFSFPEGYETITENYVIETEKATAVTITPEIVSVENVVGTDRAYDGTTQVIVTGQLNKGDFVADDLKDIPEEFFKVTTTGNTTDKNVGENKPVTYEEFSFPEGYETVTDNYVIETSKKTTVTITKKKLQVKVVVTDAGKDAVEREYTNYKSIEGKEETEEKDVKIEVYGFAGEEGPENLKEYQAPKLKVDESVVTENVGLNEKLEKAIIPDFTNAKASANYAFDKENYEAASLILRPQTVEEWKEILSVDNEKSENAYQDQKVNDDKPIYYGTNAKIKWNVKKNFNGNNTQSDLNTVYDKVEVSVSEPSDTAGISENAGSDEFSPKDEQTIYVRLRTQDGCGATKWFTVNLKKDTKAPETPITLDGENSVYDFLRTVTFGMFANHKVTAKIGDITDNASGIKEYKYYKINLQEDKRFTEDEVKNAEQFSETIKNELMENGTGSGELGKWTEKVDAFDVILGTDKGAEEEEEGNFVVFVWVKDNVGNEAVYGSNGVIIDLTPGSVELRYHVPDAEKVRTETVDGESIDFIPVSPDKTAQAKLYAYAKDVAEEKNVSAGIEKIDGVIQEEGVEEKAFSFYKQSEENGAQTLEDIRTNYTEINKEWNAQTRTLDRKIGEGECVKYTIEATAVDRAGNLVDTTKNFVLDTLKPVVKPSSIYYGNGSKTAVKHLGQGEELTYYSNEDVTIETVVTERFTDAGLIELRLLKDDGNGSETEVKQSVDEWKKWIEDNKSDYKLELDQTSVDYNSNESTWIVRFTIPASEGAYKYSYDVITTDYAGNKTTNDAINFVVDTSTPTVRDSQIESEGKLVTRGKGENLVYYSSQDVTITTDVTERFIDNNEITLTLQKDDEIITKSLQEWLDTQTENDPYRVEVNEKDVKPDSNESTRTIAFIVKANAVESKYSYYVTATDYAENETGNAAINFVVDIHDPEISQNTIYYADGSREKITSRTDGENVIYYSNESVTIETTVTERFIDNNEITLTLQKDDETIQKSVQEWLDTQTENDPYYVEVNEEDVNPDLNESARTIAFTVKADAVENKYSYSVTATDYAENETSNAAINFVVDTHVPEVNDSQITSDGNLVMRGNGADLVYYSGKDVTIKTDVKERFIDNKEIELTLQKDNETITKSLQEWLDDQTEEDPYEVKVDEEKVDPESSESTRTISVRVKANAVESKFSYQVMAKDYAENETSNDAINFVVDTHDPEVSDNKITTAAGEELLTRGAESDLVYYSGQDVTITTEVTERFIDNKEITVVLTKEGKEVKQSLQEWFDGQKTDPSYSVEIDETAVDPESNASSRTIKFTLHAEYAKEIVENKFAYQVKATDYAENNTENGSITFVVDARTPELSDNSIAKANGSQTDSQIYYTKENVVITTKVTDRFIDENEVKIAISKNGEKAIERTLAEWKADTKGFDGIDYSLKYDSNEMNSLASRSTRTFIFTIPARGNEGDFTYQVSAVDYAKNPAQNTVTRFCIDTTQPEVTVTYSPIKNGQVQNALNISGNNISYVNQQYDAFQVDVKIMEKHLKGNDKAQILCTYGDVETYIVRGDLGTDSRTATDVTVRRNGSGSAVNLKKGIVSDIQQKDSWVKAGTSGIEYHYTFTCTAESNYQFPNIQITDFAGNVSRATGTANVTLDRTVPQGTVTLSNMIAGGDNGSKTWKDTLLNVLTFGLYGKNFSTTSMTSEDGATGGSGIREKRYYLAHNLMSKASLAALAEGQWTSYNGAVTMNDNRNYIVYEKVVDKAGNTAYYSSDRVIVDHQDPKPEVTITPTVPGWGKDVYSATDNPGFDVNVVDPAGSDGSCSGLAEVKYTIKNGTTGYVESGTLATYSAAAEPVSTYRGHVTIDPEKFYSNEVQITVEASDHSTNEKTTETTTIKVDNKAPIVTFSFDQGDVHNGKYYNNDKTLTITVDERNFDDTYAPQVTSTAGGGYSISGWSHNGEIHTAVITFSGDSDYTVSYECFDQAGNKSNTEKLEEFTVDKTKPVIQVSYDNNNAQNVNYFKEARTATITINEHNFNPSEVTVTTTAQLDGTGTSAPVVSGWSGSGDTHVATVSYDGDADYSFTVTTTDLASNVSDPYATENFTVDKTKPTAEITNIEDHSANNGDVAPIINLADINFDSSKTVVRLTGANKGEVDTTGMYTLTANDKGETITFYNFGEHMDDIYTLTAEATDKAGNVYSTSKIFSVNRDGSTYMYDTYTEELVKNGYTNDPKNLVVSEINVDTLTSNELTVAVNGTQKTLAQDKDYEVKESGGEVSWKEYQYTIYADNFEEEGNYNVSIYSEDRATNVTTNTSKAKEIEFTVDKTSPVISISNLEDGGRYKAVSQKFTANVDDNMALDKVEYYVDGELKRTFDAQEIASLGGALELEVEAASKFQEVSVKAYDKAQNEATTVTMNVLVSPNTWVQFYNNKPAFYGSIAGILAVLASIAAVIYRMKKKAGAAVAGKKRKKEDETK